MPNIVKEDPMGVQGKEAAVARSPTDDGRNRVAGGELLVRSSVSGYYFRNTAFLDHLARHSERGGKRRGRQWKRRDDNIREWTGLEFAKPQRAVENREKWRKLFAKSSVVPQRPSRLRDR